MANPLPLPPIVSGAIYNTSTQVYVNNVLPQSIVTIYNDSLSKNQVGTVTSSGPGSIWVPLTKTLSVGEPITARQEYTGSDPSILVAGTSDPSVVPIPVLPVPVPLPSPIFVSGLCTCMDSVYIDGLIPGATLTITMGAATMVHATVNQTPQWFELASIAISPGAVLEAQQNIGASKSPTVKSPYPIPVAGALGKPDISPVPVDCQTTLNVSNLVPGADLKIENGSISASGTNAWSFYEVVGLPPLQPGALTAQQYFTRCGEQERGPTASVTVTKSAPEFPKVSYPPCVDVTQLEVSDVVPGEILSLQLSYSNKTGPVIDRLGSCGVSGPGPVPLPTKWFPTDAIGAVTLQILASLCDVPLPSPGYTAIVVGQTGGPYPPPTVQPPLYACATHVRIRGAHPGSQIQVFSVLPVKPPVTIPRSNPVVATAADFAIELWSPLSAGEEIYAAQQGCNANGNSPQVKVSGAPALPVPAVPGFVLAGAKSVLVNKVVPGALVTLLVNAEPRSSVDSIVAEVSAPSGSPPLIEVDVPAGSPPLVAGDVIVPLQTLCGEIGMVVPGQGGAVTVQAPVPAPAPGPGEPRGGLGSNNNYFMSQPTASGCANLINVSVKIQVTDDIVWKSTGAAPPGCPAAPATGTPGLSFQLNCYSATPKSSSNPAYPAWQQYIINLWGTQLLGAINTWHTFSDVVIFPSGEYTTPLGPGVPSAGTLPAGTYEIILGNDSSGNVNSVTWVVNGVKYTPSPPTIPALLVANGLSGSDIAPIVAFTLNLVGPVDGESAVLSSGAGIITYSASSPLTVTNEEPALCVEDITGFTCERATSSYSQLPANPPNPFSQTFAVSATTPLLRRLRGRPLVRR